jgi:DNA mismatch endonuclease (patch repair protein)
VRMDPSMTDAVTSRRLGRVRQRDTKPELIVRAELRRLMVRYTIRNRDLPGSPDIANRRRRWAIFVHGCFWHAHEGCKRATVPTRNREFWEAKFSANKERDAKAVLALRSKGFNVLTLWECELGVKERVRAALETFLCAR